MEDGRYRYLPLEKPARELGIQFCIFDTTSISPIEASNLSILVNTLRSGVRPLDEYQLKKAIREITRENGLTIRGLAEKLALDSVVPILSSILNGQLHALLSWQLLNRPESTTVYTSQEQLADFERVAQLSAELDILRQENFVAPIGLSPKALSRSIENLDRIAKIRAGTLTPNRSDYRHMERLRRIDPADSTPLIRAAPAYHLRGSHQGLDRAREEVVRDAITTKYSSAECISRSELHRQINRTLAQKGLPDVAYETVRVRVNARPKKDLAESREGHRAANAQIPPTDIQKRALRAAYAWEKAHVDSTPMDEKIWIESPLGKVLSRPTLYLLVDEATSYILAYWVCFDSAGDQAVACLFRDCIRRHEKLPCGVGHDQGSEYFSRYTETFTASTGVDLCRRPRAAGRWGAHVESGFDRVNDLFVHALPGNMQNDQRGRSSVASKRSAAHACLELDNFLKILEDVLIGWLNDRPLEGEFASPREKFERSQAEFAGLAKEISITPELLAYTAIPAPKKHRIDHSHGIRFRNRRYVGEGIRSPSLHKLKVEIRWEPYNACVIYALVNGRWERLTCRGYQELETLDNRHRLIEFYLRFNTAGASKLARRNADLQSAQRLSQALSAEGEASTEITAPKPSPPKVDLFARARSLDIN
jgi:putative transposase